MSSKLKGQRLDRIEQHGRRLLAIFPYATLTDPVNLCKSLRRLEGKAHAIALRLCNGPEYASEEDVDKACDAVLLGVNRLLGNIRRPDRVKVPVFINRDPRGYAVKIRAEWMAACPVPLERDWGGYGIIAPEIE